MRKISALLTITFVLLSLAACGRQTTAGEPDPGTKGSVFGQTNEFGGALPENSGSANTYGSDFDQTNEFGGGSANTSGSAFDQTNEFGGATTGNPSGSAFDQTNEFGGGTTGSGSSSTALQTTYATEGDFPPATAAEQEIINKYLAPYSFLYNYDFHPTNMRGLTPGTLYMMFDALCGNFGGYPTDAQLQALNYRVSGEAFEAKLMQYLSIDAQTIREICAEDYDPVTRTYPFYSGLGGGPVVYVITDYQRTASTLTFSYAFYPTASYVDSNGYTQDYFQLYKTGTVSVYENNSSFSIMSHEYRLA